MVVLWFEWKMGFYIVGGRNIEILDKVLNCVYVLLGELVLFIVSLILYEERLIVDEEVDVDIFCEGVDLISGVKIEIV